MNPEQTESWQQLSRLATATAQPVPITDLRVEAAGITADLGKQLLSAEILEGLLELARERDLRAAIEAQFRGEIVNPTEMRPALHSALRAAPEAVPDIAREARSVTEAALELAESVRDGRRRGHWGHALTDVVHIGIGGSHLGPALAVDALSRPWHHGPRIRFLANIDGEAFQRALDGLDPHRTLFVVVSKSFSTLETRINAESARSWFIERTGDPDAVAAHFLAVSTNLEAAAGFGIPAGNVYPLWDWLGGRFSVWSPVGLPLALSIGREGFRRFLAGARSMDEHFRSAPFASNLPVLMALTGIWNYNFLGVTTQAILPYSDRLALLPAFLQQLMMESNGKSVHADGSPVTVHTMPVVWGGCGTNGQHAYHQLLLQGTRMVAADFIVVRQGAGPALHQRWLNANALAQSQALRQGDDDQDPHRRVTGGRPSTTLVLPELSPEALGSLIALYEQMVFCQGVIWNINSFDQWGVELGKRLARPVFAALGGETPGGLDESTRHLVGQLRSNNDADG